MFMDQDGIEDHKLSKKRLSPVSSHLGRPSLVNKRFIMWCSSKFFLPERPASPARVAKPSTGFVSYCHLQSYIHIRCIAKPISVLLVIGYFVSGNSAREWTTVSHSTSLLYMKDLEGKMTIHLLMNAHKQMMMLNQLITLYASTVCGSIKEKMGPFLFQGEPSYLPDIEALFGNVCIGLFWDNRQCPITWS